MPVSPLERQAREAYNSGDFPAALILLNRVIARAPSVTSLDNRAACHHKLNDLPSALKDAKAAIQIARGDPMGYLRAGKVLLAMNDPKTALEIYRWGLKRVKHVGQGYQLLKDSHAELQAIVSPPKSVDPLTVLPRELALQVLEYRPFHERVRFQGVSKAWMRFIRSEPNLWRHLHLGDKGTRKVPTVFVSRAINTAKKKLTTVTLHQLSDFDAVICALVRHCPLQSVTLLVTGHPGDAALAALSQIHSLKELRIGIGTSGAAHRLWDTAITHCNTLEVLDLRFAQTLHRDPKLGEQSFPKLRTFRIISSLSPHIRGFMHRIQHVMPNLESLTFQQLDHDRFWTPGPAELVDLSGLKHLTCLDWDTQCLEPAYRLLPSTIESLSLHQSGQKHNYVLPEGMSLPRLKQLSVAWAAWPRHHVLASLKNLLRLDISKTPDGVSVQPPPPGPSQIQLQHLAIRDVSDLIDSFVTIVCVLNPKLRSLDLSGSMITGVGVRDILTRCKLETLTLNACPKISRDAIDWAKSCGVEVTFSLPKEIGNGRKVRFGH